MIRTTISCSFYRPTQLRIDGHTKVVWNPFRRATEANLSPVNHPTFNIRHYGPNPIPMAPEVEMEPQDEAAYRRIRDEAKRGCELDVQQLAILKAKYRGTWIERSINHFLGSYPTSASDPKAETDSVKSVRQESP